MLGERIPAEKALEWGIIARLVDDQDLAAESVALATRLAQGPTVALGLIRRLARDSAQLPLADALAAERAASATPGRRRTSARRCSPSCRSASRASTAADMPVELWLAYLLFCLLFAITPGPAVLLTASQAIARGFAAGFAVVLGTQLGNLVYFLLSAAGVGAALATSPTAFLASNMPARSIWSGSAPGPLSAPPAPSPARRGGAAVAPSVHPGPRQPARQSQVDPVLGRPVPAVRRFPRGAGASSCASRSSPRRDRRRYHRAFHLWASRRAAAACSLPDRGDVARADFGRGADTGRSGLSLAS